ncbi:hypothetical protein, partial [Micromonospora sp. 4G55]|uniref:hypothetical protein n=1 Tax=Micromonospora sp. 4G55 TaxID=2806102 RepID=UPI001EE449B1
RACPRAPAPTGATRAGSCLPRGYDVASDPPCVAAPTGPPAFDDRRRCRGGKIVGRRAVAR